MVDDAGNKYEPPIKNH